VGMEPSEMLGNVGVEEFERLKCGFINQFNKENPSKKQSMP